jgi:hypothetical protein
VTLKFVRHVRDLDRYRYLTLVAALILLLLPLVPQVGRQSTARAFGSTLDP